MRPTFFWALLLLPAGLTAGQPRQATPASRPTLSISAYKKAGDADFTQAAQRAIRALAGRGGGVLTYPAGTFVQGPVEITGSNITVRGAGPTRTKIVRNSVRGYAFFANGKRNVRIQNLSINCDKSPIEGGVYFGGTTNCWAENVGVSRADAATFVISNLLFNKPGSALATGNGFRNCTASGQKRYHDVGGKSPFIAGDYARNSRFERCTVTDSEADYFDSDNAPGTVFIDCVARSTKGMSAYTGFWSEGEQTDSDHTVRWIRCRAYGFTNGFGVSERAKATFQRCEAQDCRYAVRGVNHAFRVTISDFTARRCGKGLENNDVAGVLAFTGPVTMTNVKTIGTLAKNSFSNYAASAFTDEQTVLGPGCEFDKDVYVSYGNTGSRRVRLDGVTLHNSYVRYYNGDQTELHISRSRFINGGINGARIKQSRITDNTRFTATNGARTAIQLNLDNFNTTVDNTTVEGYEEVSNKARLGAGVRQIPARRVPGPR